MGSVSSGGWYHIVVTFDGSSGGLEVDTPYTLKIYINGSEATTSATDFSQNNGVADGDGPINPVYVGFGRNPEGFNLKGSLIDEFGYWNQELSSSNVTNLYNNGEPTDITSFNPSP